MRILLLSDFEAVGGAGIATTRLARGLEAKGHEVFRATIAGCTLKNRTHTFGLARWPTITRVGRRVARVSATRWESQAMAARLEAILKKINPHVINVHNLHGIQKGEAALPLVQRSCSSAPTVWTLHDMWSFTGSCAYSQGCELYRSGCNEQCFCPASYPRLPPPQIPQAWKTRKELLEKNPRLVAVSPSGWLARIASSGLWGAHQVEIIPNGVPLNTYAPLPREEARRRLGIPVHRTTVLTSAANHADKRKGAAVLQEALERDGTELTLLTAGRNPPKVSRKGLEHFEMGFIEDDATMALALNAADLLIHPTSADNLPNVIVEALACGTPVLASDTGGVPEMVRHGVSGWTFSDQSSDSLYETLQEALEESRQNADLRVSCRRLAEEEYGDVLQAERYAALFESLTS